MSFNNVTPAWMLSEEFTRLWQDMENEVITLQEFSAGLNELKDVPEPVKQNWAKNARLFKSLKHMRGPDYA